MFRNSNRIEKNISYQAINEGYLQELNPQL